MNRKLSLTLCLAAFTTVSHAANLEHGKQLAEKNCIACHSEMTGGDGSTLYTRKDRRVRSLDELKAQVQRCESNMGLPWFDDDIADVAAYLNEQYYKFGKTE